MGTSEGALAGSGGDWNPENRAKVRALRSRPTDERKDELEEEEETGRLSRDEKEVEA